MLSKKQIKAYGMLIVLFFGIVATICLYFDRNTVFSAFVLLCAIIAGWVLYKY